MGNFLIKFMDVLESNADYQEAICHQYKSLWEIISLQFRVDRFVVQRRDLKLFHNLPLRAEPDFLTFTNFEFTDPAVSYARFKLLRNFTRHDFTESFELYSFKAGTYKAYGKEAWLHRLEAFYLERHDVVDGLMPLLELFKQFDIREELDLLLDLIIREEPESFPCKDQRVIAAKYFTYD
ncbi:hypothetical protein Ciccas_003582 [Cichlidogyrus casuarinus]|uniref:Uncharacterized protein n=1 Tax=Cichlidogyrus casuarinus TaxID=1844966 RepID=A0ABD2QDY5_9PLAT